MKIDYEFIKEILLTMEENEGHEIELGDLLKKVNVMDSKNVINNTLSDKFFGHVKILGDKYLIDCSSSDYGYKKTISSAIISSNARYRITSQGYDFLDVLKNKTVFNKIKDFAFENAFTIGKQLLTQAILSGLNLK